MKRMRKLFPTISNRAAHMSVMFISISVQILIVSVAMSAEILTSLPDKIDTSLKYMFFIHNSYVEMNGPDGDCKHDEILNVFAEQDFTVVSEVRVARVIPCNYANSVIDQVRYLVNSGVSPEKIIVAGHSKGAVIALCVASQLQYPQINYVIMAGCEIEEIKRSEMYPQLEDVKGRFLSIFADSDTIAGSCRRTFPVSTDGLVYDEKVLRSDKGHKLFFKPENIWTRQTLRWITEKVQ